MSNDLERELRDALRRVDPPEGFTQRVLARAEQEQQRRRRWPRAPSRWLPVALAASGVVAAVLASTWRMREERQQGIEARAQLLEALRVTGEKLDLAYRVVNDESRSATDDTGA